jgi:hypothetical protein
MCRDSGNPVDQDSIKRDPPKETEQKGLFRSFIVNNEEKRDEGNPAKEGKIELGERKRCQRPAQNHQQDV